jgi:ion channel POLLUX/CASTOR
MSSKYTFYQRFRYFFDNTMSKGTPALVAWLGLVSLLVVVISGVLVSVVGVQPETAGGSAEDMGFAEVVWQSTMRTLDAGTMAGDEGIGYRAVMFFVTVGGIFIISTFIGVISSGLESKIEELRKGRSLVIEKNHVVILGWSSKIFTLINELALANVSAGGGVVVVMADKDKVEMEDEIRDHLPKSKLGKTKVICRRGSPHDMDDLQIINPLITKSIIIVSADEGNSDAQVIKSILALNNIKGQTEKPYHIVAEIQKQRNLEVAKMVGKEEVEIVFADEITAKIMVQTSRQTGLSLVYSNLMDFDGEEIYFKEEKSLTGKTYIECLNAYDTSCVMGVMYGSSKVVELNPDFNYVLQPQDQLIFLAEDDSAIKLSGKTFAPVGEVVDIKPAARKIENSILLGWNQRAYTIVKEMDNYAIKGSHLKVVASAEAAETQLNTIIPHLKNISIDFVQADTTDREVLESLNIPNFDYVLLLCYQEEMELQDADAETLITLLHLRRIFEEANKRPNIVSEMLDLRNCELAEATRADDFIVSDKLISLLVTQVAENKTLMKVFDSLFSADGSEIYLKPAKNYIKTGIATNFYAVIEGAKLKKETPIGYRIMAQATNASKTFGICLNPTKSQNVTFSDKDYVIVLAEEQ